MFDPLDIFLLSLGYLLTLFAIAYVGDRYCQTLVQQAKPLLIALAGTYTTAWMFFGTPAQAVSNGWYIPPTFIGSIAVLSLAPAFLARLVKVAKTSNSTSIADFIASHYGKCQPLATIVTAVAIVAVLPYIALQLKAVAMSFHTLTGQDWQSATIVTPLWRDTALYIALLMALFTIMFGTRHIDSKEHHNGLMLAVAFEALVKLLCFAAIGYFTCFVLFDGIEDIFIQVARHPAVEKLVVARRGDSGFIAATVLGMTALFCLPRQFHILMVESKGPRDTRTLRWLIPVYMLVISFFILPIGYGGYVLLHGQGLNPESFGLQLPMLQQQPLLTLLAYIGGLSAGSSMVIVSCVALATMVCNHMVMPLLLRRRLLAIHSREDMTGVLRLIRRTAIVVLLLLAYSYYRYLAGYTDLGSIGLLALVLVAQFAPAMVGALYWEKGHQYGVMAGLGAGFGIWLYTLIVPALVRAGWLQAELLIAGPFSLTWLRPEQLFNLGWSPLSNGVWWSLAGNFGAYISVSLWCTKRYPQTAGTAKGSIKVGVLREIAARFLGAEQAHLALRTFERQLVVERESEPALTRLLAADHCASETYQAYVENLLAGVIGASSAHQVLYFAGQDKLQIESPSALIEETSQVFQYGREILQASINNISQGISVVDQNLHLIFWNRRYQEMFCYPAEMLHVGRNVADLMRYNAEQGNCGPGPVEEQVRKRIAHMRNGSNYVFQRTRCDGTVLEIRGNAMPDGGFVTTYTDITEVSRTMSELENAKAHLEERVLQRTAELAQAKSNAEAANAGKTRFLAAAGHDLVQPLNASRLFISALQQRPLDIEARRLVNQLASSAQAAENLINALLDIAKLDAGAVTASFSDFPISQVLKPLASDFSALARENGLAFHFYNSSLTVHSDSHLLRRILQNLLSNALRYTEKGRVVLGCRCRSGHLWVEVWDTGIGIAHQNHDDIFIEFKRLASSVDAGREGLGLGLATVKRLCELLQHPLDMSSAPGKGSLFRVVLPLSEQQLPALLVNENSPGPTTLQQLQGMRILCIDNDRAVLSGLEALLESWQCEVACARSYTQAGQCSDTVNPPDMIIADYHLDLSNSEPNNGIDCVLALFALWRQARPCIVISADRTETVRARAHKQGFLFLRKPVKAAALRASLNHAALQLRAQGGSPSKPEQQ